MKCVQEEEKGESGKTENFSKSDTKQAEIHFSIFPLSPLPRTTAKSFVVPVLAGLKPQFPPKGGTTNDFATLLPFFPPYPTGCSIRLNGSIFSKNRDFECRKRSGLPRNSSLRHEVVTIAGMTLRNSLFFFRQFPGESRSTSFARSWE